MTASMPKLEYFTGLDLGQARDFTAVAVLERTTIPDPQTPSRSVGHYAVRHLERFPLGTAYTAVCARIAELFAKPPLAGSLLAVDQTGVGRPVIDLLRGAKIQAQVVPVTITAGHQATVADGGRWLVPKKELVSTLQVLLATEQSQCSQSRSLSTFFRLPCNISFSSPAAGRLASAVPNSNTRRYVMRQDDEHPSPLFRIRSAL
jgi:hypothetical protein